MPRATQKDLSFVSRCAKERLDDFSAGVSLEARTGYPLERLVALAVRDRLVLAKEALRTAERAARSPRPSHRESVSRAYYAMYHVFRAVVFFASGGDNWNKHSDLPKHIPRDFPRQAAWENELKSARLERNRADYDPYPRSDLRFAATAAHLRLRAQELLPVARKYLRSKGCAL